MTLAALAPATSLCEAPAWLMGLLARGEGGGFIELRRIKPYKRVFVPVDKHAAAQQIAERLTERGDVFVGMTVRGTDDNGTAANVCRANCLWADLDGDRNRLDAFPHRPHLIVESGTPGHWHAYWALPEPVDLANARERDDFVAALRGVQRGVGSDNVADLPRVMRVPGTLNYKRGQDDLSMAVPVEFRPEGVLL